ncbi:MAG TPA: DNA polymerase III subunit gamma/tau C-terminal domain-containing protein, partial [Noviherbaspirillum sp.]
QKKTDAAADDLIPPRPEPVPVVEQRPVRAVLPVPELNWDGDWPALAAKLPLRGVVHQLAQQSELLACETDGNVQVFKLRIPLDTLRSAGSVDKLANTLGEHFGKTIRVDTEIGSVSHTANAAAVAEREARQRAAEESMRNDPFVQTLMREFGATIVPGSIRAV